MSAQTFAVLNKKVSLVAGAINANELADALVVDLGLMVEHADDVFHNLNEGDRDTLYVTRTGFMQIMTAMSQTSKYSKLVESVLKSREVLDMLRTTPKRMEATMKAHVVNYRAKLCFGAFARALRQFNRGSGESLKFSEYINTNDGGLGNGIGRRYDGGMITTDDDADEEYDDAYYYDKAAATKSNKSTKTNNTDGRDVKGLILIDTLRLAVFVQPFNVFDLKNLERFTPEGYTAITATVRGPCKLLGTCARLMMSASKDQNHRMSVNYECR